MQGGLGETYSATGVETLSEVDTSGAAIVLNMGYQVNKDLNGSATIAAPATITFTNDEPTMGFKFFFTIDAGVALTLPANVLMNDPQFAAGVWTPLDAGDYVMLGRWDGTNWLVEIQGPYT